MSTVFKLNKKQELLKEQMKQSLIDNPTAANAKFVLSTTPLPDGRMVDFCFTLIPRSD